MNMWEQLNDPHHHHQMECGDDCTGPGPPPEFRLPPPPRPPFLQELSHCSEEPLPDIEACDVLPSMLDPSFHSSPSQTSTLIALCSVLFIFTICLSSFVVWKHKRKVPNFLPCKTPTRTDHHHRPDDGTPGVGRLHRHHSLMAPMYEDPDVHIGRVPLVRRHHNAESIHPKSLHYPSGYPMPHSPPIFVCSSPGPDPYRSHDNVYEELDDQPIQHIADTRPTAHSDDDFAEDELSITGDRSFSKITTTIPTQVAASTGNTIYHERLHLDRFSAERNSLLSTSSSSTHNNHDQSRSSLLRNANRRHHTVNHPNRTNHCRSNRAPGQQSPCAQRNPPPPSYEVRNTRTIAYDHSQRNQARNRPIHIINSNSCDSSRANAISSFAAALQYDVEVKRRNQLNNQLNQMAAHQQQHGPPTVSTIYRGGHQHSVPDARSVYPTTNRSRTNPRSDRRRQPPPQEPPIYGTYRQPMFHEGILYDVCLPTDQASALPDQGAHLYPYIHPEFSTFRQYANHPDSTTIASSPSQPQLNPITSRDSSFGSDSGYSHHTQSSNHLVGLTASGGGAATAAGGGAGDQNYSTSHINKIVEDMAAKINQNT